MAKFAIRKTFVLIPVLAKLIHYLSDAHVRGLAATGLLDREINGHDLMERSQLFAKQLMASFALRQMIGDDLGYDLPPELDLLPLINLAETYHFLGRRHCMILRDINKQANLAKHMVVFRSNL